MSESGFKTSADLVRMSKKNVRSFLIGESLMKENDMENALQNLLKNANKIESS